MYRAYRARTVLVSCVSETYLAVSWLHHCVSDRTGEATPSQHLISHGYHTYQMTICDVPLIYHSVSGWHTHTCARLVSTVYLIISVVYHDNVPQQRILCIITYQVVSVLPYQKPYQKAPFLVRNHRFGTRCPIWYNITNLIR